MEQLIDQLEQLTFNFIYAFVFVCGIAITLFGFFATGIIRKLDDIAKAIKELKK